MMVCVLIGPRKKKVAEHSLIGILIVSSTRVLGARLPSAGEKLTPMTFAKATQWREAWLLGRDITAA